MAENTTDGKKTKTSKHNFFIMKASKHHIDFHGLQYREFKHKVCLRSKVIVPRDAQHPKLYVDILVGGITVIPLL